MAGFIVLEFDIPAQDSLSPHPTSITTQPTAPSQTIRSFFASFESSLIASDAPPAPVDRVPNVALNGGADALLGIDVSIAWNDGANVALHGGADAQMLMSVDMAVDVPVDGILNGDAEDQAVALYSSIGSFNLEDNFTFHAPTSLFTCHFPPSTLSSTSIRSTITTCFLYFLLSFCFFSFAYSSFLHITSF